MRVELGNIREENFKLQQRMMNMNSHYTQLQECNDIKNKEYSDLQKSLREMDMHYKEQLSKSNDECKSLKSKCVDLNQRMAAKISLDLQSSGVGFEDVSDPCNESRLRGMYDDMRLKDWPKLKRKFARIDERQRQQFYDNLIQTWKELFDKANDCMEKSKQDLEKLFLQDQHQANKEKVLQNLTAATHSLQVVFSLRSDLHYQHIVSPTLQSPPIAGGCPEQVLLTELGANYYKLICLMLLHNPPMQPDWQQAEGPHLRTDERMFPPMKLVDGVKSHSAAQGLCD